MTTRHHLVRGAALSGGSVFISMAAMLVVGKIATNYLRRTDVAAFSLLLLIADGLNLALTFGLPVSLPKLLGEARREDVAAIASSALAGVARILSIASLIALLWLLFFPMNEISGFVWVSTSPYFPLLLALTNAGAMRDLAMAGLAGLHRYGPRAIGIVIASLMQIALSAYLIVKCRGGIESLVWVNIGAYALALVWLLLSFPEARNCELGRANYWRSARFAWIIFLSILVWLFVILIAPNTAGSSILQLPTALLAIALFAFTYGSPADGEKFGWKRFRSLINFSFPLYVNSLLNFVFQRFDTVLIALLLRDPVAVAVYEMAKKLPVVLSRGLGALLVPFLPAMAGRLASDDREGAARLLRRASVLTAVLGYGAVLGAVAVQELLIKALFSKEYLGATSALGALMAATVIAVLTGLQGQTLIALGRPAQVTAVNVLTALASVGLNVLLIPRWGLLGAGIASVLASALSGGLQTVLAARAGVRMGLWTTLAPHAFAAFAFGVLWATHASTPGRTAALAVFVVLCLAGRLVGREDWAMLREAARRG